MKNLFQFAILSAVLAISTNVFADVKIKSRQTVSGQSFENTIFIKGKRERTERNMGGMETVDITQCDLKRSLQIMPAAQSYTVNAWAKTEQVAPTTTTKTVTAPKEKGGVVTTTYTIKDTGERKQMFGYQARHLIITMETESSPDACQKSKSKMQTDGWYIDAAFALECDMERSNYNYKTPKTGGCQDRYEMKQSGTGKRGYPLYEKMTMFDENGKETTSMVNEVLELSKATLQDSLFDVPEGYREVKDSTELYASMSKSMSQQAMNSEVPNGAASNTPNNSGMSTNIQNLSKTGSSAPTEVGAKKAGVVRLGLANVKTGTVGEGVTAQELSGAVQNTLSEYLKSPNIEVVALEAKLPSAIETEAKTKECDYVIYANVAHKKGGGGFGMFKNIAPVLGSVVPMAGMAGGIAGSVAGSVASSAIYTAAGASSKVKSKDEITLDIKLQNGSNVALTKQYKAKAKSDGEDIISQVIEQAAQAIIDAAKK